MNAPDRTLAPTLRGTDDRLIERRMLRVMSVFLLTAAAVLGISATAHAATWSWWSGSMPEDYWASTHPNAVNDYWKLEVKINDCSSMCVRYLNSNSSGLTSSSGDITHYPADGFASSVLRCKWTSAFMSTNRDVDCLYSV